MLARRYDTYRRGRQGLRSRASSLFCGRGPRRVRAPARAIRPPALVAGGDAGRGGRRRPPGAAGPGGGARRRGARGGGGGSCGGGGGGGGARAAFWGRPPASVREDLLDREGV